jgi:hypothetical protein
LCNLVRDDGDVSWSPQSFVARRSHFDVDAVRQLQRILRPIDDQLLELVALLQNALDVIERDFRNALIAAD